MNQLYSQKHSHTELGGEDKSKKQRTLCVIRLMKKELQTNRELLFAFHSGIV